MRRGLWAPVSSGARRHGLFAHGDEAFQVAATHEPAGAHLDGGELAGSDEPEGGGSRQAEDAAHSSTDRSAFGSAGSLVARFVASRLRSETSATISPQSRSSRSARSRRSMTSLSSLGFRTNGRWVTASARPAGDSGPMRQPASGDEPSQFGSQLHAPDYVEVGIPTVMPTNIGDNRISVNDVVRVSQADAERLSRHRLRTGDIVYSRRGDVEKRALVREAERGWLCGTGSLRVRVGTAADSTWLSYYLGHPEVRSWIVRHAVGATMPNLNSGILSALPVSVPPVREQRAIAEVLGALDDKIEANRRLVSPPYRDPPRLAVRSRRVR